MGVLEDFVESHRQAGKMLDFAVKKPNYFSGLLIPDKLTKASPYYLQFYLEGPRNLSRKERFDHIKHFIGQLHPEWTNTTFSDIGLTTPQQDKMTIDHTFVDWPESPLEHYVVHFYLPERKRKEPLPLIFIKAAEELYGLRLNFEQDLLSKGDNPRSNGWLVSTSSGLAHGTSYEREAYRAIQKGRRHLSAAEVKAIKRYRPELIQRQPRTGVLQGTFLQATVENTRVPKFIAFLYYLSNHPPAVQQLNLTLGFGSTMLNASSHTEKGELRMCYATEANDKELHSIISSMGTFYQRISGVEDEQFLQALERSVQVDEK